MADLPAGRRRSYALTPVGPAGLIGHPGRLASAGGTLGGALQDDKVAIWLIQRDGNRLLTMWPGEYRACLAPLELLNEAGQVIAREGDDVTVRGGFLPADDPRTHGLGHVFFAHLATEESQERPG